MPALRTVLTVLALACAPGLAAAETAFTAEVPAAGLVRAETSDTSLNMKIDTSAAGRLVNSQKVARTEHKKTKTTVLELTGKEPTRVRIVYEEYRSDDPQGSPAPVLNKAYLVELIEGRLSGVDEKGNELTPLEGAFLFKEFGKFGKPDPLAKALDGKTLKPGDKVKLPDEDARLLFDVEQAPGVKLEECTLTFKGLEKAAAGQVAVFDTKVLIAKTSGMGSKMTTQLTGPIAVDPKTCWTVSMKIGGPIVVGGSIVNPEATVRMSGGGESRTARTASYTKP
ncbi:MAG: hypothetical protein KIS92_01165 [Planctomycetota bacterium]|nr:hypothetical protein [Planctomycetota bacterium]